MGDKHAPHGDEAVEKVEADRTEIGLSDKNTDAATGDPNKAGGEPTRVVETRVEENTGGGNADRDALRKSGEHVSEVHQTV